MKKSVFNSFIFCILFGLIIGCKPKVENPNTDENLTTIQFVIQDVNNAFATDTFTFNDPDGNQILPANIIDTIRLNKNGTYLCKLLITDATKNPIVNVSDEILAEAEDHLFIFNSIPDSLISIKIIDKDAKNLPLGLQSEWHTSSTQNGFLKLTLRHQPGVKNGTPEPGDSDLEIEMPVAIL